MASKTVMLAGVPTLIHANENDPYFANLDGFATSMIPLHDFVSSNAFGGTILDVGANIGLSAIAMARAAPNARIIAFEPSPISAELFRMNTREFPQIELVQAGAGDREADVQFLTPQSGGNAHVLTEWHPSYGGADVIRVPIVPLDTWIARHIPNDKISFTKIDVEGLEPHVLYGLRATIPAQRLQVWIEFNSIAMMCAHGYLPSAFARALFDAFDVYRVQTNASLVRISSFEQLVHDNIILYGSVEDVVLKYKPASEIGDVEWQTLPRLVVKELRDLRQKVKGIS